jgi:hypothetical protein
MSPIASMVRTLIDAGTPPDVAATIVAEAYTAGANARPAVKDEAQEKRRASDRERKRLTRHLRLSDHEWYPLVTQITQRDGGRCQYCGCDGQLTADHVVPMSRGGTHDPSNLVACCLPCNSKKSNHFLAEWLPNPQMSAGQKFVSDAAREIIVRETSAEIGRHLPTPVSALTPKKDNLKKVSKRHPLPPEWKPSEVHFLKAAELNIPRAAVEAKAEDMRLWALGKGELKADWDATFHGFLRRDAPKLAVRGSLSVSTITPESPNWNPWRSFFRDTGKHTHVKLMDKCASDGKPFTVQSEWPPGMAA